jgi:hypothetical protein
MGVRVRPTNEGEYQVVERMGVGGWLICTNVRVANSAHCFY